MSRITVLDVKTRLQQALNALEQYNDEDTLPLESNTYFVNNREMFLGIRGYNGGYVPLSDIHEDVEIAQDEEEYDE